MECEMSRQLSVFFSKLATLHFVETLLDQTLVCV
jgi:hypothetical protein